MALTAGRNIALFAVVATPVLTYHLESVLQERGWVLETIKRPTRMMARMNALLVGLVLLGSLAKVLLVLDTKMIAEAQAMFLPVEATEYLKSSDLSGPMFNSYNWGGYLILNLPDEPVYVDGRTDLYGNDFLQRYLQTAVGGDEWRETLDEYDIRLVFVEAQSGLARHLRDEPGWTLNHEDDLAVIFSREDANE
jgi:hypothetical protein